eukprot:g1946.t1
MRVFRKCGFAPSSEVGIGLAAKLRVVATALQVMVQMSAVLEIVYPASVQTFLALLRVPLSLDIFNVFPRECASAEFSFLPHPPLAVPAHADVLTRDMDRLYLTYKPKFWYFELVMVVYRIFMVGVLALLRPGTLGQVAIGIALDFKGCSDLTTIKLANNALTGAVPAEYATLQKVKVLDASHNAIGGTGKSVLSPLKGMAAETYVVIISNRSTAVFI